MADNFHSNHLIPNNILSIHETEANDCVNVITSSEERIPIDSHHSVYLETKSDLLDSNFSLNHKQILTTTEEIAEIISNRPNKMSVGPDMTPYTILKNLDTRILLFLTVLFNHLLSNGYFLRCWRRAKITPIAKAGKDSTIILNWRPISLIDCLSKIFEKIIQIRINNRIYAIPGLFKNQFGFTNRLSTYHPLSLFQMDVNNGLNKGWATTLINLDMRAAFDTVWHAGLILKLQKLKLDTLIIKIIYNFLSNREFVVSIDGFQSEPKQMPYGVPQGSVLGPTLFNLYLNDLPVDNQINTLQFADDTSLYHTYNNALLAQSRFNIYLERLVLFFKNWKLTINADKTSLLHIVGTLKDTKARFRRHVRNMVITVDGNVIQPSKSIRLLGVHFQSNNRFFNHVRTRLNLARRASFHFFRFLKSKRISSRIKLNVYKLYIRPIITYAAPVWLRVGNISSCFVEKIRLFERGVIRHAGNVHRAIGQFKYIKNESLYETTNITRIDRHMVHLAIKFFKRCSLIRRNKIPSIVNGPEDTSQRNMPVHHLKIINDRNELLTAGNLMIFNRRRDLDNPRPVYSTGQ